LLQERLVKGVQLKKLFPVLCLIKIGTRNRTPSSDWIITALLRTEFVDLHIGGNMSYPKQFLSGSDGSGITEKTRALRRVNIIAN